MLGHKLCQMAASRRLETFTTMRTSVTTAEVVLPSERVITAVDAVNIDSIVRAVGKIRPEVVVNCIGIVKQLAAAKDPVESISINSLFPHRLAQLCRVAGARLIHISTDCVFSGKGGMYKDDDFSDAEDLYGRSKYLGEVFGEGLLTLRTSIIGRELTSRTGLIEWFLGNDGGRVRGFDRAVFSGLTTIELARLIVRIIEEMPDLSGVYNVSADPIDKYSLLELLRDAYGATVEIERDSSVQVDRSLDSSRFRELTGYTPPSWPDTIRELASDQTSYGSWRSTNVAGR